MTTKIKLPNGQPLRLSPTRMMDYDACPAMFKTKILGLAVDKPTIYTETGTAAHYVIEQINIGKELDAKARETLLMEKLIELCAAKNLPVSFTDGYRESKETVLKYEVPKGWRLLSAEKKQVVNFDTYDFSYIIDAVFETPDGTILIIDYKTSAQAPKNPLQLMLYGWIIQHRFPEFKGRKLASAFWMLRKDELIRHDIGDDHFAKMEDYMGRNVPLIGKMLRMDELTKGTDEPYAWPVHPSNANCRYCPAACDSRHGADKEGWS